MNENHAPALLPVGFCDECLAAIDAGTFVGSIFSVRGNEMRLVGGYCPHNQVSAVRLEHDTFGKVGPCIALTDELKRVLQGLTDGALTDELKRVLQGLAPGARPDSPSTEKGNIP